MKQLMFVAVFGLAGLLAACGDSGGGGGSSGIVGTWKIDADHMRGQIEAKMKEATGGQELPEAIQKMMQAKLDEGMAEIKKTTITFNADGTMSGVGPKEGSDEGPVMETKSGTWTKTDTGYSAKAEGDKKALNLVLKDGYLEAQPEGDDMTFRLIRS